MVFNVQYSIKEHGRDNVKIQVVGDVLGEVFRVGWVISIYQESFEFALLLICKSRVMFDNLVDVLDSFDGG